MKTIIPALRSPPCAKGKITSAAVKSSNRFKARLTSQFSYTQLVQRFLLSLTVQGP